MCGHPGELQEGTANAEKAVRGTDLIRQHLYRELKELKPAQQTSEVRQLVKDFENITLQLDNIGKITDHYQFKMGMEKRLPWWILTELYDAKCDDDSWITERMRWHLGAIGRKRETINSSKKKLEASNRKKLGEPISTEAGNETSAFQAVVGRKGIGKNEGELKIRPYVSCEEEHWNGGCRRYRSCDERLERLSSVIVCFICFKSVDASRDCRARIKCFHCKLNQNPAL